jgi:hypothetical protein
MDDGHLRRVQSEICWLDFRAGGLGCGDGLAELGDHDGPVTRIWAVTETA